MAWAGGWSRRPRSSSSFVRPIGNDLVPLHDTRAGVSDHPVTGERRRAVRPGVQSHSEDDRRRRDVDEDRRARWQRRAPFDADRSGLGLVFRHRVTRAGRQQRRSGELEACPHTPGHQSPDRPDRRSDSSTRAPRRACSSGGLGRCSRRPSCSSPAMTPARHGARARQAPRRRYSRRSSAIRWSSMTPLPSTLQPETGCSCVRTTGARHGRCRVAAFADLPAGARPTRPRTAVRAREPLLAQRRRRSDLG